MSPAIDISRRLLVGGGRRDTQTLGLSVAALAMAMTVAALTLGVINGLVIRDHRLDWTRPAPATGKALAVQSLSTTYVSGQPVQVVRLAGLSESQDLPTPPGMTSFPQPGQAAWSPALRSLLEHRPAQAAALGGAEASTLGREAVSPGQLLAVIGVPADQLQGAAAWQDPVAGDRMAPPTLIDGFDGRASSADADDRQYVALGWVAAVLLLVPALTLGGSAARLGERRRTERLATLRLIGAPARLLRHCLALEVGVMVAAGAISAWLVTLLTTPLLARVQVGGAQFNAADLRLGPVVWLGLVVVMSAVLFASTATSLRSALANPLAVVEAHSRRQPGWWRVAVAACVVIAFSQVARGDGANLVLIVIVFAGLFGVLNVVGPLVVSLLGKLMLGLSRGRGPGLLLAARRVLDDPQAAWRAVSGVALAAFVAGFLALFQVSGSIPFHGAPNSFEVAVPASDAANAARLANENLRAAGIDIPVSLGVPEILLSTSLEGDQTATLKIPLPADADAADLARGVMLRTFPGAPAATAEDLSARDERFPTDIANAAIIVLLTSFATAVTATAITVTAATLDRREVYRRLWQAGVSVTVLDRARNLERSLPLLAGTLLSASAGMFAAAPLTLQGGGVSLSGGGLVVLTLALGLTGTVLAVRCSRPLLMAVTRS